MSGRGSSCEIGPVVMGPARNGVGRVAMSDVRRAGRTGRQGGHVVEMQRRRLLTATLELVYERGVQAVTIALVSDRAGVSRKTFYDIFSDRETCLLAAFEEAVNRAILTVQSATVGVTAWRERVRAGLVGVLSFLDGEPVIGRLLIVEALGAGEKTLNARSDILGRVIAAVDEGRMEAKRGTDVPPLTAEGVVGAVFSVIHARMLVHRPPVLGVPASRTPARLPSPISRDR
jgi:AcrR family transcriptional regulator